MSAYPVEGDRWRDPDLTCSYCGGLKPEEMLRLWAAGEEVSPTDKNYKVYITGSRSPTGKTYFQHFSEAECQRFINILNGGTRRIAHPGHFYVRPFFVQWRPRSLDS